ncbi:MAG TPA: T9SS type A sorting domain-containing protein [Cytophagaceae bacterium]
MAEVSVYPNPSQDKIYINNEIFSADYYIYDAKGTLINKGEYNDMNGIPVSSLETGQYIIRLKDRDKEWMGRFIK